MAPPCPTADAARSLLSGRPACVLRAAAGVILTAFAAGCAIVDVGVSNPLPSCRRVAVAPFINLSTQPDLDLQTEKLKSGTYSDRRFSLAYFAELQKTPGFEVIPVGVVERAIAANRLPMNGPRDYVTAADRIGADAIVVGAVTDYDPYHPRLGLQINWYAVEEAVPPCPTQLHERQNVTESYLPLKKSLKKPLKDSLVPAKPSWWQRPAFLKGGGRVQVPSGSGGGVLVEDIDCIRGQSPYDAAAGRGSPMTPANPLAVAFPRRATASATNRMASTKPLYSYVRYFDGRDAAFTARLRDYVELSGDRRSGGWEAYLNRSDDFIRFCSHLMIEEMLLLHGGESRRDVIFKKRTQL